MRIHKAIQVKIHPTVKQQKQLNHHFGAVRFIYNYFLQLKTDQYEKTGKSYTFNKMNKHLTELKKQPGYNWLNQVSRQCLINSISNLDVTFNNFFNKKAKYPKFKNKYGKQSFKICTPFYQIKEKGIHLPQIGVIKCKPELPKEYKLNSVTIKKTSTDKYYASINIETDIPDSKVNKSKPIIGIDFGLKYFIATSDGIKINHPKPFKESLNRLKREQRKLSRKIKGSKKRSIQRKRVALVYEKMTNRRKDFLHKLSSKMIDENQAIYLEDLNLKGMMSRYGKQINDLGWGMFTRQLEYKGQWYNCLVNKIDRFFPSSKTCSNCGHINNNLTLKDREWICVNCSAHHDRDINAAKNILKYGSAGRNLVKRTGRIGSVGTTRGTAKALVS